MAWTFKRLASAFCFAGFVRVLVLLLLSSPRFLPPPSPLPAALVGACVITTDTKRKRQPWICRRNKSNPILSIHAISPLICQSDELAVSPPHPPLPPPPCPSPSLPCSRAVLIAATATAPTWIYCDLSFKLGRGVTFLDSAFEKSRTLEHLHGGDFNSARNINAISYCQQVQK